MTRSVPYETELGPDRVIRGTIEVPPEAMWPAPVVLFCHGFKGFKDWGPWPWLCRQLADRGFIVNRFNFSHSGVAHSTDRHDEPEKFARNTYGLEIEDLGALLARRQEWNIDDVPCRDTVGLLGHSRGGLVSLLYAAGDRTIGAVVTLGSPGKSDRFGPDQIEQWRRDGAFEIPNARTGQILRLDVSVLDDFEAQRERYDIQAAIQRRPVPTMVVHAEDDETVPVGEANLIHDHAPVDARRLELLAQGGHTFGGAHPFVEETPELTAIVDHAADWFREHL